MYVKIPSPQESPTPWATILLVTLIVPSGTWAATSEKLDSSKTLPAISVPSVVRCIWLPFFGESEIELLSYRITQFLVFHPGDGQAFLYHLCFVVDSDKQDSCSGIPSQAFACNHSKTLSHSNRAKIRSIISSKGKTKSRSGSSGAASRIASQKTSSLLKGTSRVSPVTAKLLPKSANDWISPVPSSCSPAGFWPSSHFSRKPALMRLQKNFSLSPRSSASASSC